LPENGSGNSTGQNLIKIHQIKGPLDFLRIALVGTPLAALLSFTGISP
jgi:hypothetical protein